MQRADMKRTKHKKCACRRWLTRLLGMGGLAWVILALLFPLLRWVGLYLADATAAVPLWLCLPMGIAACGMAWWPLKRLTGFRESHLRIGRSHIWVQVPTWLAGLLIWTLGCAFMTSLAWTGELRQLASGGSIDLFSAPADAVVMAAVVSLLFFTCGMALVELLGIVSGPGPSARLGAGIPHHPDSPGDWSYADFAEWCQEERPLLPGETDLFGSRQVATAIVQGLFPSQEEREVANPTALYGGLGAGKSSVLALMVEELARQRPQVVDVWVTGWDLAEGGTAASILGSVRNRLGERLETTPVFGISEQYRTAIGESGGGGRFLALMLSDQTGPEQVVSRLDDLLEQVDLRLLIILEDLERGNATVGGPGRKRLRPELAGLLDRFRSARRVTYLIATSPSAVSDEDMLRLCTRVERVPVDRRKLAELVWLFLRSVADNIQERGVITLQDEEWAPEVMNEDLAEWLGGSLQGPHPELLASLLNTPRRVKSYLREFVATWASTDGLLHKEGRGLIGEIQPKVFLSFLLLKFCVPKAIDLLDLEYGRLTAPRGRHALGAEEKPVFTETIGKLERLALEAGVSPEWILPLAETLFPRLKGQPPVHGMGFQNSRCPSGKRGEVYWARLLRGGLHESEVSDQEMLHAFAAWDSGERAVGCPLYGIALKGPDVVEHLFFLRPNEPGTMKSLADLIVQSIYSGPYDQNLRPLASTDALKALLSLLYRSALSAEERCNWALELVKTYGGVDLSLSPQILSWLRGTRGGNQWMAPEGVGRSMVDALTHHFEGQPDALVRAWEQSRFEREYAEYRLVQLVILTSQLETGESEQPLLDGWGWLPVTLLEAIRLQPDGFVPQTMWLLYSEGGVRKPGLHHASTGRLFIPHAKELGELVRTAEFATRDSPQLAKLEGYRSAILDWVDLRLAGKDIPTGADGRIRGTFNPKEVLGPPWTVGEANDDDDLGSGAVEAGGPDDQEGPNTDTQRSGEDGDQETSALDGSDDSSEDV